MAKTKEFHLYKAVFLIAFISLLQNKQLLAHDVDQRLDTVDIQNLQENQRLVVGQNFGPMFDNIDGQVIYSQVREVEIDRTDIFTNAQRWILENIQENNTIFGDINAHRLTIMGTGKLKNIDHGMINISYQIDWKDKKYRYKFKILDIYTDQFVGSFDSLLRHPEKTGLSKTSVEETIETIYKSMLRHIAIFERNMKVDNKF